MLRTGFLLVRLKKHEVRQY